MNSKRSKELRKMCRLMGLSYELQKSIYQRLSLEDRKTYIQDMQGHLNGFKELDERNKEISAQWQRGGGLNENTV